uniref:Tudor domain-containing protein n=1 Tax=Panagrellus redivivus TaxID=6233 RepID=A0A7E4V8M0_PANRE
MFGMAGGSIDWTVKERGKRRYIKRGTLPYLNPTDQQYADSHEYACGSRVMALVVTTDMYAAVVTSWNDTHVTVVTMQYNWKVCLPRNRVFPMSELSKHMRVDVIGFCNDHYAKCQFGIIIRTPKFENINEWYHGMFKVKILIDDRISVIREVAFCDLSMSIRHAEAIFNDRCARELQKFVQFCQLNTEADFLPLMKRSAFIEASYQIEMMAAEDD